MDEFRVLLFGLLPIGLVVSSLSVWVRLAWQRRQGRAWVAYTERRDVPWGLLSVGGLGWAMLLGAALSAKMADQWLVGRGSVDDIAHLSSRPADDGGNRRAGASSAKSEAGIESEFESPAHMAARFLGYGLGATSLSLVVLLVLSLLHRANLRDVGFVNSQLMSDLRLGGLAFLALVVPVLSLQLILTQVFHFESEHPLSQFLGRAPTTQNFLIVAFVAVIAAPLFEEVLFRLLLQGWLEKLDCELQRAKKSDSPGVTRDIQIMLGTRAHTTALSAGLSDIESSKCSVPHSPEDVERSDAIVRPRAWTIAVSASLFALAHISHGPDWIPLLLLAIGLGYLYRQTHRLVPSVVVHFLVNSLAVLQLWNQPTH